VETRDAFPEMNDLLETMRDDFGGIILASCLSLLALFLYPIYYFIANEGIHKIVIKKILFINCAKNLFGYRKIMFLCIQNI
jgi:hypothetical protein